MTRAGDSDNLLLFSSASGLNYGYDFDGWKSDATFHYTGEGQVGDQVFTRGNAALRDHALRGLRPRLFEEVVRATHRYLGEFRLAAAPSYYTEEAKDRLGDIRKVIVFRLVPVDSLPPAQAVGTQQPTSGAPTVRDLPLEQHLAETFQTEPNRQPTEAERRESALVQRYAESLATAGQASLRKEIGLPDLGHALYIDLFNTTTNELVEAKSSAARHHVRLAIGQLCDYGRFIQHDSRAVLLPSDPGADLTHLLNDLGVACIYEDEGGDFVRREPPPR